MSSWLSVCSRNCLLASRRVSVQERQCYLHPICASPLGAPSVPPVHLLELLIMIVIGGLLISGTLAVRGGPCEGKEEKLFARLEVTDRLYVHIGEGHSAQEPCAYPSEQKRSRTSVNTCYSVTENKHMAELGAGQNTLTSALDWVTACGFMEFDSARGMALNPFRHDFL